MSSQEMMAFQKLHDLNPSVFVYEKLDGSRFETTRESSLRASKLGAVNSTPNPKEDFIGRLEEHWKKVFATERVSVVLCGCLWALGGRGRYPVAHVVDSMKLTITRTQCFMLDVFQRAGFLVDEISQTSFQEEGAAKLTHQMKIKLALNSQLENLFKSVGVFNTPKSFKFDDMSFVSLMKNKAFWEASLKKLDSVGSPSLVFTSENTFEEKFSVKQELCERWLNKAHVTSVQENLPFLDTAIEVAAEIHRNNLWVEEFVKTNEDLATYSALTKLPVENFLLDFKELDKTLKLQSLIQYLMDVALEILKAHSQAIQEHNLDCNERWKINDYLEVFDKQPLDVFLHLLLKKSEKADVSISATTCQYVVHQEQVQYPFSALMLMNE